MSEVADRDAALVTLLRTLDARGYAFVTPSPLSHVRVLARAASPSTPELRDIFGWNRPFALEQIEPFLRDLLNRADALQPVGDLVRCRYRVSRCEEILFLHSAFPTLAADSVFFGPDSYRFARWIRGEAGGLGDFPTIIDLGAGAGAGALSLSSRLPDAALRLVDLNTEALRLARINATAAGIDAAFEDLNATDVRWRGRALVIANPPYMADDTGRLYRDGGDMRGAGVSVQWARAIAARLQPGDAFLLYTGVAIVAGQDPLRAALEDIARACGCALRYEEIDPDVWGEELERADFRDVDRVAVVGAVFHRDS